MKRIDIFPDVLTPVESRHLLAVAGVHARAFPDSALTRLGLEAVRRYYEWQLQGPHQHDFVGAFENGVLLGFAVGGRSRGALAGFVQKNRWFLARQILRKPRLLLAARGQRAMGSAWLALRRLRTQASQPPAPSTLAPSFGVLAIAVDPARQGRGLGLQLMEHLEGVSRRQHFTQMHLTVSVANTSAIRFYEKLGWTRRAGAPWTGSMIKALS